MERIFITKGLLSTSTDDEAAARKRKELREKLLRGEEVKVTPRGEVKGLKDGNREQGIIVPEGKLASYYWYEREPGLLEAEKKSMQQYFPQFRLEKLSDGRLSWVGELRTDLRPGGRWYLQAIYSHTHPSNDSWGGSVRVYSIEPDLEDFARQLGQPIPHTLSDSNSHLYICTARKEDVRAGTVVTSAASSLAWAAKWIAAFELWLAGDLKTDEFRGHDI